MNASSEDISLTIAPETVCFLIARLRAYDALGLEAEQEDLDNPLDEADLDEVRKRQDSFRHQPMFQELATFIDDLSFDEQVDLVALTWLGRDGLGAADWPEVRAEAEQAHNSRTVDYLLGSSMAADYLAEGLAALGHTCGDAEEERL